MQPRLRESAETIRETPGAAVRASRNAGDETPDWLPWLRSLGIAAAAGAFLAFTGVFGTSEAPLLTRLIYWLPLMTAGSALGHLVSLAITRFARAEVNPWLFGVVETIVLAVPVSFVVWGYTRLVFGTSIPVEALPGLFGSVLLISAAMTAIMIMAHWPGRVTHAPAEGAPPATVRFMERLPAKLKGAVIYAVAAEDHYLRLHTSKGSDLILMRLSDAIAELDGLEGAQTHRSWWVARDAVESARREGDRATLTLKGGAEAPVSRPNVKALREAGWF